MYDLPGRYMYRPAGGYMYPPGPRHMCRGQLKMEKM